MLKILEDRRKALQKKVNRLKTELQQSMTTTRGQGVSVGALFGCEEAQRRLSLYSDYELLQNANEQNIEGVLEEIVEKAREEQDKAFNYFDLCSKENPGEAGFGLCDRYHDQALLFQAIEHEATDLLALFEVLNALDLLDGNSGEQPVSA